MRIRKLTLAVALSLTACFPANAGWLENFYDDAGGYSNVSSAGAYKGQSMNVYSGGSFFLRMPSNNFQLAAFSPPSLKVGCNGIDGYLGSFSFINRDRFVQMLRQVATSTAFAYTLAMSGLSPIIEKTTTTLRDAAQKMNALNVNSCQMGKGIGLDLSQGAYLDSLKNAAAMSGVGPLWNDASQAYSEFVNDPRSAAAASIPAAMANADMRNGISHGNVMWRALKRIPPGVLDDNQRMVLMSIIGTVIIDDINGMPKNFPGNINVLQDFIGAPGVDKTSFKYYRCTDSTTTEDGCMQVEQAVYQERSFRDIVHSRLSRIAQNIQTDTPNTSEDAQFINSVSLPVYKAIGVYSAYPNSELAEIWIQEQEELLAAEYAASFIQYTLKMANDSLMALTSENTNPEVSRKIKELLEAIPALDSAVRQRVALAYQKAAQTNQVAERVMAAERTMVTSLSSRLSRSLAWSSNL